MHSVEREGATPSTGNSGGNAIEFSSEVEIEHDSEPTFSLRGVLAGGLIGTLICFASLYYGLQAGQTNSMPLPSALLAFAMFKPLARCLRRAFNPNENVLVMTVAASMAGIPYTAGLSGTIPALEYLTTAQENGPMIFTLRRLILWCLGVCLFGIVFAVPFRKHFVLRSHLRFPTGTAMAAIIGVLHQRPNIMETIQKQQSHHQDFDSVDQAAQPGTYSSGNRTPTRMRHDSDSDNDSSTLSEHLENSDIPYQSHSLEMKYGLISFIISGFLALVTYFIPKTQTLPVFGTPAAEFWAWSVDMSPAYVGYGMIMHPLTTVHMLLGAVIGWAILSPLAKAKGWAPGPVEDWDNGSQGWTIWISLAIILGDSFVGISWIVIGLLRDANYGRGILERLQSRFSEGLSHPSFTIRSRPVLGHSGIAQYESSSWISRFRNEALERLDSLSTPDERTPLITAENNTRRKLHDDEHNKNSELTLSGTVVFSSFVMVILSCIIINWFLFGTLLRVWEIFLSVLLIFPLAIASIRSMGETDNALASSLGKISQFLFALLIPKSNRNAIIISLLIGGIAEGGTYQSSDVMEHLKTGHLVGASPKGLFYGQILGSIFGAILCSCVYKLFTSAYAVPSERFTIPHARLWLASAHLAYGRGLPPGVWGFAIAGFILSAMCASARIAAGNKRYGEQIPSGIAIGIGIYILPMYTIPQTLGGVAHYWYKQRFHTGELSVITVAVGLILGQSLVNILTLLLGSAVNV